MLLSLLGFSGPRDRYRARLRVAFAEFDAEAAEGYAKMRTHGHFEPLITEIRAETASRAKRPDGGSAYKR